MTKPTPTTRRLKLTPDEIKLIAARRKVAAIINRGYNEAIQDAIRIAEEFCSPDKIWDDAAYEKLIEALKERLRP